MLTQFALTSAMLYSELILILIKFLGSVHKYFGGGGWAKWRGTKKFSLVKEGGSKKFGQIESIMKIKMHNLLPKLTGYSLRLDLYFKIFPGPSAGPALHRSHNLRYAWHLFREPRVQITDLYTLDRKRSQRLRWSLWSHRKLPIGHFNVHDVPKTFRVDVKSYATCRALFAFNGQQ